MAFRAFLSLAAALIFTGLALTMKVRSLYFGKIRK